MSQRTTLILSTIVMVSPRVVAETIQVPTDFPTIQEAIDAAVSGADKIVVAAGTYNEAIDFLGKAITLRSAHGAAVTTIDATGLDSSAVLCVSGEGPATVFEGFTITGGTGSEFDILATPIVPSGGGMYNLDSSPTVRHCHFVGNSAERGGGMYNVRPAADPLIEDCVFSNNTASSGAGMSIHVGSRPTMRRCTFVGNFGAALGGGLFIQQISNPVDIVNCKFIGNSSNAGGGLAGECSAAINLTNCAFIGNSGATGGAIRAREVTTFTVTNCSMFDNSAKFTGGGVWTTDSNTRIRNSVFWFNSDSGGMSQSAQIHAATGSPEVIGSNVQGLVGGGQLDSGKNVGNISADPEFIDADGVDDVAGTLDDDLRLSLSSPCIDAGFTVHVPKGVTTDLAGFPRVVDIPEVVDTGAGTPAAVDMGAFEAQPPGQPIPALSHWGLAIMALLVGTTATLVMRVGSLAS